MTDTRIGSGGGGGGSKDVPQPDSQPDPQSEEYEESRKEGKRSKKRIVTLTMGSGNVHRKIKLKEEHETYRDVLSLIKVPQKLLDQCKKDSHFVSYPNFDFQIYDQWDKYIKPYLFVDNLDSQITSNVTVRLGFKLCRKFNLNTNRFPDQNIEKIPEEVTDLFLNICEYESSVDFTVNWQREIVIPSNVENMIIKITSQISHEGKHQYNFTYPPNLKNLSLFRLKAHTGEPIVIPPIPDTLDCLTIKNCEFQPIEFPKKLKCLILVKGGINFDHQELPETLETLIIGCTRKANREFKSTIDSVHDMGILEKIKQFPKKFQAFNIWLKSPLFSPFPRVSTYFEIVAHDKHEEIQT